jgi:hypothetical protein
MAKSTTPKVKLTEREKLFNRLIKHGNNVDSVNSMLDANYEYVSKHYTGIAKMAEVIICL